MRASIKGLALMRGINVSVPESKGSVPFLSAMMFSLDLRDGLQCDIESRSPKGWRSVISAATMQSGCNETMRGSSEVPTPKTLYSPWPMYCYEGRTEGFEPASRRGADSAIDCPNLVNKGFS